MAAGDDVHLHFPVEVEVRSVPAEDPSRPGLYFPVEVEVRAAGPGFDLDDVAGVTLARLAHRLEGHA